MHGTGEQNLWHATIGFQINWNPYSVNIMEDSQTYWSWKSTQQQ